MEERFFGANTVNEEDPERDRATQVQNIDRRRERGTEQRGTEGRNRFGAPSLSLSLSSLSRPAQKRGITRGSTTRTLNALSPSRSTLLHTVS